MSIFLQFLRLRRLMSRTPPACFQGNDPMNVLVAYILDSSGVFDNFDKTTRIKMRTIFELFAHEMLTVPNFQRITQSFGGLVEEAGNKLVTACIAPEKMELGPIGRNWSTNETVLLLAGAKLYANGVLQSLLKHRPSYDSWNKRVKRVIADLTIRGRLSDQTVYIVEQGDFVSIPPSETRVVKEGSGNKGMLLAQVSRKLKTVQKLAEARRAKKNLACERRESNLTTDDVDDEELAENSDYSQTILTECAKLLGVTENGRRYSQFVYDIGELLRATSRKTYRVMRQLLPLPSEVSLFSRYGELMRATKVELTDTTMLEQRISRLLSNSRVEYMPVTIAIDAFSFRTFTSQTISGSQVTEEYSNAFLFLHIPFDYSFPVQVLHIQKKTNGAYDNTVQSIFHQIKEIYTKHEAQVWFKATDGDRFLSREHESFFDEYVAMNRNDYSYLIQEIHDRLCEGCTMPIADPLHFGKNMRGKLLDHFVAVVDSDCIIHFVDREYLQKSLNLKDTLDDLSQLGRMRDVYVTKLFTLENVCKLIEDKKYAGAFVLLPYASIFTVLYATNLSVEARFFFAKLAYLSFNRLLTEAEKLVANNTGIKHRFYSGCLAVTIAEPAYIKRMMHTCLAVGIAILFGPNTLRLDALGTHLVENAIGISRTVANSTKYDSICSAFATAELRKTIAEKYGITLHIPKRVNDGGTKIDTIADGGIGLPEEWDANDIVSLFAEVCNVQLCPASEEEFIAFGAELRSFVQKMTLNQLSETSEVANALIVQRNYRFKSTNAQEDDKTD